jgi:aspartate aminotransferase-like enzyme
MDEWGVDVMLAGAQKALGIPPGLSILAVSEEAMERRRSRESVPAYYVDFLNWIAPMQDPRQYFSTHAVNELYGLRRALQIIEDEGLSERFERHARLAEEFRAEMTTLGFVSLTQAEWLAPTLSVLAYPVGLEDASFLPALSAQGVVAAGCLGAFRGLGARFGHMGNTGPAEIERALDAIRQVVSDSG